jgi:hypothetical protein
MDIYRTQVQCKFVWLGQATVWVKMTPRDSLLLKHRCNSKLNIYSQIRLMEKLLKRHRRYFLNVQATVAPPQSKC